MMHSSRPEKIKFSKKLNTIILAYVLLLMQFLTARLFYLFDHRNALDQDPYHLSEILQAFFLGARPDMMAISFFILPMIIWLFVSPLFKINLRLLRLSTSFFVALLLVVNGLILLTDHFFYVFYKNHFNIFFYEAFENLDNTLLAMDGISDVVTPGKLLGLGIIFGSLISGATWIFHKLSFNFELIRFNTSKRIFTVTLLYLFSFRATFHDRPIPLQIQEASVSKNGLVNLALSNPYLALYKGYQVRKNWTLRDKGENYSNINKETFRKYLEELQSVYPHHEVAFEHNAYQLKLEVQPTWETYFHTKPKHVVLITLESFSKWITDWQDGDLNNTLTSNFNRIKSESLSMENYFPGSAGTIKNTIAINYSFNLSREHFRSLSYTKESFKQFPDTMPRVMSRLGYDPYYFYAGSGSWHDLEGLTRKLGYKKFLGRHSFEGYKQNKYGFYDEDFFIILNEFLKKQTNNTFITGLNIGNHPPYYLPDHYPSVDIDIGPILKTMTAADEDLIQDKMNAFRYSDHALGNFFKIAKNESYFSDTVFLITADHPFGGAFHYPTSMMYKESKNPLLIYAPKLMKEEYIGKNLNHYGSHLDLIPTIASIITDNPIKLTTWGHNFLEVEKAPKALLSYAVSCLENRCIDKNYKFYELSSNEEWTQVSDNTETDKRLKLLDEYFYKTQAGYIFQFQEDKNGLSQ